MDAAKRTDMLLADERPLTTPDLAHIRELDGIRGIAVLAVFAHHICHVNSPAEWGVLVRGIVAVSVYGSAGVDLFFVLSGFLITSLLLKARTRPRYYQDFYWKRALRILPLYLFCLVGVLLFFKHSGAYVVMSLLFVANLAPYFHIANMGGPFWSLAIEEQFYLIWPTVIRRLKVKGIETTALILVGGTILFRIAWAMKGHHDYVFLFARADGLALGAWVACRYPGWKQNHGWSLRDARATGVTFILAWASIFAAEALKGRPDGIPLADALMQAGLTLLFGSIIAFVVARSGAGYLGVLRSRALSFFGLISYDLYLLHLWVLYLYDHFVTLQTGDTEGYLVRMFVILGGAIAFALATRYAIELPALNLRRYVIPSSDRAVAAETVGLKPDAEAG